MLPGTKASVDRQTFSMDLRERVVAAVEAGALSRHQATQFRMGLCAVIFRVRRLRETAALRLADERAQADRNFRRVPRPGCWSAPG